MTNFYGPVQLPVIRLGNYAGYNGVYYPATRAGASAAVLALTSTGGVVQWPENTPYTWDTTTINLPSKVSFIGGGPSAVITVPAALTNGICRALGSISATSTVAANVARGAFSFTHNQTGGLTFAAGDIYELINPATANRMVGKVYSVSGAAPQTVNVCEMICESFTTAAVSTVAKITPAQDVRIANWYLNGNGTSDSHGITHTYTERLLIENCYAFDFNGAVNTTGLGCINGGDNYQLTLRNCKSNDCGSRVGEAAMNVFWGSQTIIEDCDIQRGGFGMVISSLHHFKIRRVSFAKTNGRTLAVGENGGSACSDGSINDCILNGETFGTGLSYRGGSHHITDSGNQVYGCINEGWYCANQGEHDITVVNLISLNNTLSDIRTFDTNYNITFVAPIYGTKSIDPTLASVVIIDKVLNQRYHVPVGSFVNNTAAAPVALATSGSNNRYTPQPFNHGADTAIQFTWIVPNNWIPGTAIGVFPVYTALAAGGGTVVWTGVLKPLSQGDDINAASGETSLTGNLAIPAQNILERSLALAQFTPAAAGQIVRVNIGRNGSSGSDSATSVGLWGFEFNVTGVGMPA